MDTRPPHSSVWNTGNSSSPAIVKLRARQPKSAGKSGRRGARAERRSGSFAGCQAIARAAYQPRRKVPASFPLDVRLVLNVQPLSLQCPGASNGAGHDCEVPATDTSFGHLSLPQGMRTCQPGPLLTMASCRLPCQSPILAAPGLAATRVLSATCSGDRECVVSGAVTCRQCSVAGQEL
jgi:hypothetical protein